LYVYNFGKETCAGALRIVGTPQGWHVDLPPTVQLAPGERKQLSLRIEPGAATDDAVKVRIVGDFPGVGRPVLSVRFVASKS